jgi:hypothetical protein
MTISRMQQPRQQYGLGSIVKKAVKGVSKGIKKFAKSDLGKVALLGATAFGIPGTSIGGLFGRSATGMFGGARGLLGGYGFKPSMLNAASKLGLGTFENVGGNRIFQSKGLLKGLTRGQAALGIGAASTLAGILASDPDMTEDQAEELKQDPVALRNYLSLYYSNLNPNASKEEVESFVRTNMYATGGRVGYKIGGPGVQIGGPPPLGSPQGGTSLYGDVLEYLKRQGKDAPQRISPEGIDGIAMPYGGGSFNQSGGAINTPTPPAGGGPGTGMLQTAPSAPTAPTAPTVPMPKTQSNVNVPRTPTNKKPVVTSVYWNPKLGGTFATSSLASEEDKLKELEYLQHKDTEISGSDEKKKKFLDAKLYEQDIGDIKAYLAELYGYNNGGRVGYRSGDVVDQASGIMGLPKRVNKAGVKELDLRKSGGFIPPVGVKEKADDIPAMLSNNEFVFTADAVRGMGDGNVNKGAQRMYDMMKKLEEGGRV